LYSFHEFLEWLATFGTVINVQTCMNYFDA